MNQLIQLVSELFEYQGASEQRTIDEIYSHLNIKYEDRNDPGNKVRAQDFCKHQMKKADKLLSSAYEQLGSKPSVNKSKPTKPTQLSDLTPAYFASLAAQLPLLSSNSNETEGFKTDNYEEEDKDILYKKLVVIKYTYYRNKYALCLAILSDQFVPINLNGYVLI